MFNVWNDEESIEELLTNDGGGIMRCERSEGGCVDCKVVEEVFDDHSDFLLFKEFVLFTLFGFDKRLGLDCGWIIGPESGGGPNKLSFDCLTFSTVVDVLPKLEDAEVGFEFGTCKLKKPPSSAISISSSSNSFPPPGLDTN